MEKINTVVIGSDHAGYKYKEALKDYLLNLGYDVLDVGTLSLESCDYPDYAKKAANMIIEGNAQRGVLICGTGEGISIAANKVKGIRCGIGYNKEVSKLIRLHNDCQMIAFGERFQTLEEVKENVKAFLETEFEGGRHLNRVNKI